MTRINYWPVIPESARRLSGIQDSLNDGWMLDRVRHDEAGYEGILDTGSGRSQEPESQTRGEENQYVLASGRN